MLTSAPVAPADPASAEDIAAALDQVTPLQGLPFAERLWLATHGREFTANPGDVLFEEGAPAEHMVIILRGEIHVRRQQGGPMALFIARTAQITGIMPFSRMKSYGGLGTAITPVWALLIPQSIFPAMMEAIPSMAQRAVSTLLDRVREVTRIEQQAEKLTALGKLAGNLAHEESLRNWLQAAGAEGATEIAPPLAEQGATVSDLEKMRHILGDESHVVVEYFARYLRTARAAEAMVNSTARIFELIEAVKTYSNMDRAAILDVDVPAGLDATLRMYGARLECIEVEREYAPDVRPISAYGGELNQVWSALIENALDAMGSRGRMRLACRLQGEMLLVEVEDSGPGIPPELRERIFEPFFTTKPPGRALGLGLDTAMRVVRKHRGHLGVGSRPGSTCFRVRLPLDQFQAY